jgi:L-rhamnono-1,4-lactonase
MVKNGHQRIVDSHVHLWLVADANFNSHAWMTPDRPLAKHFSILDHVHAINRDENSDYTATRFVYVETDHRTFDVSDTKTRTSEHLKELSFLGELIETSSGYKNQPCIDGVVPWASIDSGLGSFKAYIEAAQEEAGALTWSKVRVFRYLLQGIRSKEQFRQLDESSETVDIFKIMGKNKWCFDVGVDQRRGGIWQLQLMVDFIESQLSV